MVDVEVFVVECSSEEETWRFYFSGKGDEEQFERDVRECVRRILNEKYALREVESGVYVRADSKYTEVAREFVRWLREEIGYSGKIYMVVNERGTIYFAIDPDNVDLNEVVEHYWKGRAFFNPFLMTVEPHQVVGSEEFLNCMKRKGWEPVNIVPKGIVWFYEWGGFVQGEDGKWYNHVWNSGYREV